MVYVFVLVTKSYTLFATVNFSGHFLTSLMNGISLYGTDIKGGLIESLPREITRNQRS